MDRIELVCLQILLGQDENLKIDIKFHKRLEKKEAIGLLETAIEELKEVLEDE